MNELTINLNPKSQKPMYEQIYEYIKNEIQKGRISCREKLPSTRALASHLEVSRSTIELAYEQLLSEGYIEAEPYRGFFVAEIEDLYHLETPAMMEEEHEEASNEKYLYDFTPNGVDLSSFPYTVWRKISKDILLDGQMELFRLGDSKGEYGLRKSIANYLYQARGLTCNPGQIIVGAGNDYMLMLLSALLGSKHRIAFENPTYTHGYGILSQLGYDMCTINMDKSGMKPDELEQTGADMAYVMPSHQYPLGVVMPIKRRMELLKWANEREERYIIEDDYDSEFRYKGKPIPALKGYDENEKVIYLGTFSKSIAPAIRISYMVLPKKLRTQFENMDATISSSVSKVDQKILQQFIDGGHYERHLNRTRALYKSRHDTLIQCLKPLLSKCEIKGEHAGVHLLLTFHNGRTEEELIELARAKGIKVYGLSEYSVGTERKYRTTILLGYANMTEEKIKEATELLVEIW
ncbi:PLP-dependent aminotransferase family protein [Lachnospiraceae bacterium OttesenSCG-928-E19]|nr:PLP-dependent aminotransferase family protein [Lachnospiraceae bacterium OttesenSCG-928-E19]